MNTAVVYTYIRPYIGLLLLVIYNFYLVMCRQLELFNHEY